MESELRFEQLRDKLSVGELTAVEQMAFDNLLHDRFFSGAKQAGVTEAVGWVTDDGMLVSHHDTAIHMNDGREPRQCFASPLAAIGAEGQPDTQEGR